MSETSGNWGGDKECNQLSSVAGCQHHPIWSNGVSGYSNVCANVLNELVLQCMSAELFKSANTCIGRQFTAPHFSAKRPGVAFNSYFQKDLFSQALLPMPKPMIRRRGGTQMRFFFFAFCCCFFSRFLISAKCAHFFCVFFLQGIFGFLLEIFVVVKNSPF